MSESRLAQSVRYWRKIEERNCALGSIPTSEDADHQIYVALRKCDAKRAEANAFLGAQDPLMKLRAMLSRGRLEEASSQIDALKSQAEDRASLVEVLLEESRLQVYSGAWSQALGLCIEALSLEPAPVTRATLHQLKALALFELGEMHAARDEIDRVDTMKSIFPEAGVNYYCEVLKIRVQARDRSPSIARESLDRLWSQTAIAGKLNEDICLTLIRTAIDLKRLEGLPHLEWAAASKTFAERIGDNLYARLALLDLSYAGAPTPQAELERSRGEFVRIRRLTDEVSGYLPRSTTARAIAGFTSSPARMPLDARCFVLPSLRITLSLSQPTGLTVRHEPASPQLFVAIQALANGPLPKAELFRAVWGARRYSSTLHDATLRRLLHRLRSGLGAGVTMSQGIVSLEETAVLS